MSCLEEHARKKKSLLIWYDKAIDSPLLCSGETLPDTLRERRAKLMAEHFVVAICGQMNSGKSTIMNALLFQDEILPMSTTTMTAKITLMEGASEPSVETVFYTLDEWKQVVAAADMATQSGVSVELAKARRFARDQGLNEAELLQYPARMNKESGLKSLVKYVGISEEGGLYTPYVSKVTLRADLPWLHEVTVADTPGTSDPNPERDKLTKQWIQQADAVIYVTYAGQAGLDAEDVVFLDENLLHVPPSRRIIAVNKCDGIQGAEEVIWSHLRGLREQDLRLQSLLNDEDQVILVVGLAGLIAGMEDKGRTLSEQLREARPHLAREGWLDIDRHGVGRLRQKVEERLLSTRGNGLIESHSDYLRSLFERATRSRENEVSELLEELDLLSANMEQRAEERKRINALITVLGEMFSDQRGQLRENMETAKIQANDKNVQLVDSINSDVKVLLSNETQISNLASQGIWILSQAVEKKRGVLSENLAKVNSSVKSTLEDVEQALSEILQGSGLGLRRARRHFMRISPYDLCRQAVQEIMEEILVEGLQDVVKDAARWWQRLFNTAGGRQKALGALEPLLGAALKTSIDKLETNLFNKLEEVVETAMAEMEKDLRKMLARNEAVIEELNEDDRSESEQRAMIDAKLIEINKDLAEVVRLRNEMEGELAEHSDDLAS